MNDKNKSVQKMYNASSSLWHTTRIKKYKESGTSNWPVIQKYLNVLTPSMSILDVGCGDGRLLTGLPDGVLYTGIDFSQELLKIATVDYPDNTFVYGDIAQATSWKKLGLYDRIFAIAVLHHISTRELQLAVLRHMREHLNDKGQLILSVWNLLHPKYRDLPAQDGWVEVPFATRWKRGCYRMDQVYLSNLLTDAGWTVEDIHYADGSGRTSNQDSGYNLVAIAH